MAKCASKVAVERESRNWQRAPPCPPHGQRRSTVHSLFKTRKQKKKEFGNQLPSKQGSQRTRRTICQEEKRALLPGSLTLSPQHSARARLHPQRIVFVVTKNRFWVTSLLSERSYRHKIVSREHKVTSSYGLGLRFRDAQASLVDIACHHRKRQRLSPIQKEFLTRHKQERESEAEREREERKRMKLLDSAGEDVLPWLRDVLAQPTSQGEREAILAGVGHDEHSWSRYVSAFLFVFHR